MNLEYHILNLFSNFYRRSHFPHFTKIIFQNILTKWTWKLKYFFLLTKHTQQEEGVGKFWSEWFPPYQTCGFDKKFDFVTLYKLSFYERSSVIHTIFLYLNYKWTRNLIFSTMTSTWRITHGVRWNILHASDLKFKCGRVRGFLIERCKTIPKRTPNLSTDWITCLSKLKEGTINVISVFSKHNVSLCCLWLYTYFCIHCM